MSWQTLLYHNVYRISILFPEPFPNRFQDADYITYIALGILYAHIHDASIVRDTIKCRVDLDSPFSKHRPNIPREDHIRPAFMKPVVWDIAVPGLAENPPI